VRSREICGELLATAKFEEPYVISSRQLDTLGTESAYGGIGAEGAAVIQERHRHEIVPEHDASYADERQDTDKCSGTIPSFQVDALVLENPLEDRAPSI
jgi:hypothetical protein